ncbi:MAG TPA: flavodoxin family protein [Armatimonadota bacterium]|nr:flavodoxin family protein [Armatimonadota bacterium]
MAAEILGISGSPIENSNTDRAVKRVLDATGMESEFIKLSDHSVQPCRACLKCVQTNRCVVPDDGPMLADKFQAAKAFVLGSYPPFSSIDAWSKSFMERMYALRHLKLLTAGKVGASVITSACPPDVEGMPPSAEMAQKAIGFWMGAFGMENLGGMVILGNVPCIACGVGDECPVSGIKMMDPEGTVESVGVNSIDDDAGVLARTEELGQQIRAAVDAAEE